MNRFVLLAALLLLGLLQNVAAQNAPREVTIIATRGLGKVENPLIEEEVHHALFTEFQTRFREIVQEHKNPILIDLGQFVQPHAINETSYTGDVATFFRDSSYDAVVVTNRDMVTAFTNQFGMKNRPASMESIYISALDIPSNNLLPLSSADVVEHENGARVGFVHLSDASKISALPEIERQTQTATAEASLQKLSPQNPDLTLVFSELMDSEINPGLFPNAGLVYNLSQKPWLQESFGGVEILYPPQAHEIQIVTGKLEDAGGWKWDVVNQPWIAAERLEAQNKPQLPIIGMSVPGQGRVAQVLNVDPQTITVEVFRDVKFPGLTDRTPIYVYLMELDGKVYRVYRTHHMVHIFWLPFDALVVVNPDHTLRQFVTNVMTIPYMGNSSRMNEAIQSILIVPMEEWKIQDVHRSGVEEMVDEYVLALRNTLLIDKQLYGAE
jgi:hypothetical protein